MQVYDSYTKNIPLVSQFVEVYKCRGLLKLLIVRDLTVRYKRSVLGVGWSLLNPILTTTVMFFLFNNVFMRNLQDKDNYLPYLFSGVLLITFFNQGVNFAADAIASGSSIFTKVYVRPETFALSGSICAAINFSFGLIPLTIVVYAMNKSLGFKILLIFPILILMIMLTTGVGVLFSIAYVQFDDSRHLIQVLLLLLTYLTPVFYTLNSLGPRTQEIVAKNPLTSFLNIIRDSWGGSYTASINDWIAAISFSSIIFIISLYIFAKWWPKGVTKL